MNILNIILTIELIIVWAILIFAIFEDIFSLKKSYKEIKYLEEELEKAKEKIYKLLEDKENLINGKFN